MKEEAQTPPQNDPSCKPRSSSDLAHGVIDCFDAYGRIRGARDNIIGASRVTPWQEQRAFDDLAQAIARLRKALG